MHQHRLAEKLRLGIWSHEERTFYDSRATYSYRHGPASTHATTCLRYQLRSGLMWANGAQ